MPTIVIEQIRENIITAVNTVSTGNGYMSNLTAVKPERMGQATGDGVIVVGYGERAQNMAVQGQQVEEWVQEFVFTAFVVQPEDLNAPGTPGVDYNALATQYEADIRKALNVDVTRGNLAHDTRPGPPSWFPPSAGEHEGLVARCYVRYRTVYGDPYTVR